MRGHRAGENRGIRAWMVYLNPLCSPQIHTYTIFFSVAEFGSSTNHGLVLEGSLAPSD